MTYGFRAASFAPLQMASSSHARPRDARQQGFRPPGPVPMSLALCSSHNPWPDSHLAPPVSGRQYSWLAAAAAPGHVVGDVPHDDAGKPEHGVTPCQGYVAVKGSLHTLARTGIMYGDPWFVHTGSLASRHGPVPRNPRAEQY